MTEQPILRLTTGKPVRTSEMQTASAMEIDPTGWPAGLLDFVHAFQAERIRRNV